MRFNSFKVMLSTLLLSACASKGTNPIDPFEPYNREVHKFNMAFDATALKPAAKLYKAVLPAWVRSGINNFYNNINMLPTVANDLLQADGNSAIKDTWRFIINSTFGVGGLIDVASTFQLPPHSNDLGLTFAKWGNKNSPYIVIPLMGPSTMRDGMAMMFDYALFTPYPYLRSDPVIYGLLALRYVDLRSQMLENDRLMAEALDSYSFIRDAYLQHRQYLMTGEKAAVESETQQTIDPLYVDEDENETKDDTILPATPTPANGTPSKFPITTSKQEKGLKTRPSA